QILCCHQRAVSKRNAQQARLRTAHELALNTPGLIAVAADDASVVGSRERAHHELSGLDIPNFFTNLFNDAAVLVSHRGRLRDGLNAAIRPKVRSADTSGREAKDGIRRLDDCRLGPILETNITRAVEHSSLHGRSPYFNCMV